MIPLDNLDISLNNNDEIKSSIVNIAFVVMLERVSLDLPLSLLTDTRLRVFQPHLEPAALFIHEVL
jgi:hypothetical protein